MIRVYTPYAHQIQNSRNKQAARAWFSRHGLLERDIQEIVLDDVLAAKFTAYVLCRTASGELEIERPEDCEPRVRVREVKIDGAGEIPSWWPKHTGRQRAIEDQGARRPPRLTP